MSLGEGSTPLVHAKRLGEALGFHRLFLKDETREPTGSFKDRPLSVAVTRARQEGFSRVATASSGNASSAAAAYSSRAGFRCYVMVQDGSPLDKIMQTLVYGAVVIAVKRLFAGTLEELSDTLRKVSDHLHAYNVFCWTPINPYTLEGSKSISYEICEQMGWEPPDFVVTPTAGGDNLTAQWKGYREFERLGIVDSLPRMVAVQAHGASPLVKAWERKLDHVERIDDPTTVASGLRAAYSGDHALRAIRESKGLAVAVSDESIVESERLLARTEGIWVEPSSATTIAAVSKLREQGILDGSDTVVCTLTGSGFKDFRATESFITPPTVVDYEINRILSAFDQLVENAKS